MFCDARVFVRHTPASPPTPGWSAFIKMQTRGCGTDTLFDPLRFVSVNIKAKLGGAQMISAAWSTPGWKLAYPADAVAHVPAEGGFWGVGQAGVQAGGHLPPAFSGSDLKEG